MTHTHTLCRTVVRTLALNADLTYRPYSDLLPTVFMASSSNNIDGVGNLNASLELPCDRPWPELDLFLPVCLTYGNSKLDLIRRYEFLTLFLRSYLLFWPNVSRTSLNIVYDSENGDSYNFKEMQQYITKYANQLPGPYRLTSNEPSTYYKRGHDRQQRLMFWADNFTTAEYVGFVDTDCVLITYVDREDLFENGKPVINGRSGNT
jgi:hypothetical protein